MFKENSIFKGLYESLLTSMVCFKYSIFFLRAKQNKIRFFLPLIVTFLVLGLSGCELKFETVTGDDPTIVYNLTIVMHNTYSEETYMWVPDAYETREANNLLVPGGTRTVETGMAGEGVMELAIHCYCNDQLGFAVIHKIDPAKWKPEVEFNTGTTEPIGIVNLQIDVTFDGTGLAVAETQTN